MNDSFLPEGYKEEAGGYMKLEEGENKFRILSSAVVGWEYWNEDNDGNRRPVRKHLDEDLVMSEIQEPDKVKRFWAFIVWNYKTESIQILELTQKSIKQAIQALISNKKWGSPVNSYDLTIVREGKDKGTKYSIVPDPKEPTDKKALEALKKRPINLEALFKGEDPFISFTKDEERVNPDEVIKGLQR